jgi:hypothetical protein
MLYQLASEMKNSSLRNAVPERRVRRTADADV